MQSSQTSLATARSLCVCSYEDRPEAMDSVILMAESLCRVDLEVSLHLTIPAAPAAVRAWAQRRPEVLLTTEPPPDGVTGWDVKPWLLLEELRVGRPEAVWIDTDMIVTRPISAMLKEFPRDCLIVAEEWDRHPGIPVSHFWELPSARLIQVLNACFVRALPAHRPLLERWFQMVRDPSYRAAQAIPLQRRPIHLLHDGWLLIALLESAEFGQVPFDYLRLGRHIAQCAGSSGYRPHHRFLDLFRGLPPLIHCIGRKPWVSVSERGRAYGVLIDLATDVSPYVLAARKVARDLDMAPRWLDSRTSMGALLRTLTACHPALAGLPLAVVHALGTRAMMPARAARRWLLQSAGPRAVAADVKSTEPAEPSKQMGVELPRRSR